MTADTEDRLLDATLACVARFGVSKTTLDDVAREAGCSRATLYRCFPSRRDLFLGVVGREVARLTTAVHDAVRPDGSLADALTATIVTVSRHLAAMPSLQFVLDHEPDALMPYLCFDRADLVFGTASAVAVEVLEPWLAAAAAQRAGELVARILLAYIMPTEISLLTDPASVRALVDDFVVTGLERCATTKG